MLRTFTGLFCALFWTLAPVHAHDWEPEAYDEAMSHAPTPLPDRVILTWNDDPATTQSVTWRTDASVQHALAEIAVANANGRALRPEPVEAVTTTLSSDLGEGLYHTVTFRDLEPETLYAYRVGDGANWSEYFHFRTASREAQPFSFVYFGDAQNELKTHWSRVFREAFRDAPRAAFTLHAGDLINVHDRDAEWGEWHGAPGWVNGTIPVIATPGNHEYFRENPGPENERYWNHKNGQSIQMKVRIRKYMEEGEEMREMLGRDPGGRTVRLVSNEDDKFVIVGEEIRAIAGYEPEELLGRRFYRDPLRDRPREPGSPAVSLHWRTQFEFPIQDPPAGLEETCYYIDYQGARIISLDSNKDREVQVEWLRDVLQSNPQKWTILTFHHPIFSPARDRDNRELRDLWKPLFDEFKVDLVLTGHDHTYARTGRVEEPVSSANVPGGFQQAYDPEIGTVYVVSVSGPKLYDITKGKWAARVAEDTQLYQVISIAGNVLNYKAYTATGELYDTFSLHKTPGEPNQLREALPPENRRR